MLAILRCFVGSDSGSGIKKFVRQCKQGTPHATVVHKTKKWVALQHFPIKDIKGPLKQYASALPTTTSRLFRVKAGDQGAESVFAVLRRSCDLHYHYDHVITTAIVHFSSYWLLWRFRLFDEHLMCLTQIFSVIISRNPPRLYLKNATSTAHSNVLASAWMSKNIGLEGVAKEIRIYAKAMHGKISPYDACKNTN